MLRIQFLILEPCYYIYRKMETRDSYFPLTLERVHNYTTRHYHSFLATNRCSSSYWYHMSRLEICVSSLLRLIIKDTYIDRQRLHVSWLVQSFLILILYVDEESIWHYTEAYILQHIRGFLFFSFFQESLEIRCILCFYAF